MTRRSFLFLLLWAAVLAAPAAVTRFDGLPFSSFPEAIVVGLFLPFAWSASQRRLLDRMLARSPRLFAALFAMAIIAAGLKAALAPARPMGFTACYQSPLSAPPAGRCERVFDNPFFRFDATRIDPVLDFGPSDWDLSFVNSLRFNFYPWLSGLRRSDRLPFTAAWRGVTDSSGQDVIATYVGSGSVGIDATSIDLPASYDVESTVRFTIPAGRRVLRIYYTFDDRSTTDRRPSGPYATFRLTTVHPDGTAAGALTVGSPARWQRAVAVALDLLVVFTVLVLAAYYARLAGPHASAIALVAGTFAAAWLAVRLFGLPMETAATLIAWSLLPAVLRRHRSSGLLLAYFVLLTAGIWIALEHYPRLDALTYRTRGEDWLTYESHARTMLETWSFEGAEPVFYMQPLFRYVRFAEHLLFGESDPLIDTAAWVTLHWTILWGASTLFPRAGAGRARVVVFSIAAALTLALAGSKSAVEMIRLSLSEHATWIFTIAAFALLSSRRRGRWIAGSALLGAALITRPNQAPAIVVIAAALLIPRMWRRSTTAWIAAAVFCVVCLLPLAHNLYYGGRAVVFTTTADSPATLGLPVATFARATHDVVARAAVLQALRGLVFLPPWRSSIGNDDVRFVIYGLLAVWMIALSLALRRSVPAHLRILTFVPIAYLGVHLFYAVGNYYPRHIMAAYFAMGLVTMTIAALAPESPTATAPTRTFVPD